MYVHTIASCLMIKHTQNIFANHADTYQFSLSIIFAHTHKLLITM